MRHRVVSSVNSTRSKAAMHGKVLWLCSHWGHMGKHSGLRPLLTEMKAIIPGIEEAVPWHPWQGWRLLRLGARLVRLIRKMCAGAGELDVVFLPSPGVTPFYSSEARELEIGAYRRATRFDYQLIFF